MHTVDEIAKRLIGEQALEIAVLRAQLAELRSNTTPLTFPQASTTQRTGS